MTKNVLNEKLIAFPVTNPHEGHIVIMAGSPGSGKNFAIKNFTNLDQYFKIFDVDEMKHLILKSDVLYGKFHQWLHDNDSPYKDLTEIEIRTDASLLKDSTFVGLIHKFIDDMKLGKKKLQAFLNVNKKKENGLPNIVFNTTFGSVESTERRIEEFLESGYEREKIHVLWVFTTLQEALSNNDVRARTVDAEYLKTTYKSIFQNMYGNIVGQNVGGSFDTLIGGDVWIIVNQKAMTDFHIDTKVVKDFYYLKVKHKGSWVASKIYEFSQWIYNNVKD